MQADPCQENIKNLSKAGYVKLRIICSFPFQFSLAFRSVWKYGQLTALVHFILVLLLFGESSDVTQVNEKCFGFIYLTVSVVDPPLGVTILTKLLVSARFWLLN